MNPLVLLMMGASLYGGAYGAAGAIKAGSAERRLAFSQASVIEKQAQDVIEAGQKASERHALQVEGLIGSQRASFGASGVRADVGTAAEVEAETRRFGEADTATIRRNASLEAWGLKKEADILRQRGRTATRIARTQADTSFITGATQAGSTYLQFS